VVLLPMLLIALLVPLAATRELRLSPIEILLVATGPLLLIGTLAAVLTQFMKRAVQREMATVNPGSFPSDNRRDQAQPPQSEIRTPKSEMDHGLPASSALKRLWHAPAFVLVLLYGALLVLLFSTVPALPQRMAIHFNADGAADGWASRTTHALFIAGLPLFITALFVGIAFLTPRFPKLVNLPRRDYWLAPERVRFTAALLLRWLLWLACLMTIFFGALHWIVLLANQTQPAKLSMSQMLPLVIGFLIGCMIWTTSLIMRFAETERYAKALLISDPARRREQWRKWARQIVIGVLIATVLRTWAVGVYVIRNDSIAPELPADSRVLVWKLSHGYAPGDLVVYRESALSYAGRVTGKDSDTILVNRNGVPDFRVRRETVAGKVISVLWRGSSNELPTGPELPSEKNRPTQP
jgi:hypothetical protein